MNASLEMSAWRAVAARSRSAALVFIIGWAFGCTGYYPPWDRGIDVQSPPLGAESTCAKACTARAPACSAHECARGCRLVFDRFIEKQGDRVIACMAYGGPPCDDRAWARCATRVGAHADGGPPAPPAPSDDEVDDEP
jgi:hypothetical protein